MYNQAQLLFARKLSRPQHGRQMSVLEENESQAMKLLKTSGIYQVISVTFVRFFFLRFVQGMTEITEATHIFCTSVRTFILVAHRIRKKYQLNSCEFDFALIMPLLVSKNVARSLIGKLVTRNVQRESKK